MTKQIELTQGKFAIVDDEWFAYLMQWRWCYHRGYARSSSKRKALFMHRIVTDAQTGQMVDHINGNGLDNRFDNLRIATPSQNSAHSKRLRNRTSGYRGVTRTLFDRWWIAHINIAGHHYTLGRFETAEEAARVYDSVALYHFGEFAVTNFQDAKPMSLDELRRRQFASFKKDKTSIYRGVTRRPNGRQWTAAITIKRKMTYLGIRNSAEAAARLYDDAAKKHYGKLAHLNFPEE